MQIIYNIYILLAMVGLGLGGLPESEQAYMLDRVNAVRDHGCFCGDQFMQPVGPVTWNDKLYRSAASYAREMSTHDFFGHYGAGGTDIGERLDGVGYRWEVAGENLGEGQKSFDEVLRDWKDSPSHCRMLMNPRVKEMAVARYDNYWVQHWGKELPPNAVPKPHK